MSRQYEHYMEERQKKQERLLDLPDHMYEALEDTNEKIIELNQQLEKTLSLSRNIDDTIRESNSLKEKAKNHFVGGLVGAILGAVLTVLIGG
jgi:hypothetical protein